MYKILLDAFNNKKKNKENNSPRRGGMERKAMESCCLRVTDMPLFLAGETDNLAVNNG